MLSTISDTRKDTLRKIVRPENFKNFRFPIREKTVGGTEYMSPRAGAPPVNQILVAACADGIEHLTPHLEAASLVAGKELYAPGENGEYVYFPETAVVSYIYNSADGNALEIAMVGCEGATGLGAVISSAQPPAHQAIVTIGGSARRIKTSVLRQEFLRGGKLQILLLEYFNAHLAQISQRVVCESFHSLEKRLCSWLLMLCDRAQENQLQMTQEQISLFLGVNRPSLTNNAKILRDKGLINYVRGSIFILDRQRLEMTACECYSAVRKIL